ncbi:glutamine synthetase family protein [Draconibacterium sp. IB214405]|uniref:glutamine synthetase family protein n=1 Tax=Draconibacterium sp. IB214405 TaxID=3097352 RepID=UPI002A10D605|nr:glutamine synthetase family protein [Draconibacterium sp. IB214405]MDX8340874.1 glutamine synthetase family protein [Draconibacterium sp. IB214405]
MKKQEILAIIKAGNFNKIKFAVADIDGVLRGKYIHKDKFFNAVDNGLGFCDVIFGWDCADKCYENSEITGWHTGYPDAKAEIAMETFRQIPWEENTPFFLGDFSNDPKYADAVCSRTLLKRIARQSEEMGFKPIFSQEFEWFNFQGTPSEIAASNYTDLQPITPGMFGYSILRSSLNHAFFNDLFELLQQFDIPLEGMHTETGPGVIEATVIYDDILAAADKALLFKSAVKEIAYRHNFVATFMAKWNKNLPGCGGHIHQSLWDLDKKQNLFFNSESDTKMSQTMQYYIAGLLKCLPEILPMFAPNPNSYKRLCGGDWAPRTLTWGIDNRTCAVRAIPGSEKSTRIELRVPGSDTNAYLALGASLAAGLYGIKNKLPLEIAPTTGNGYLETGKGVLPDSLEKATKKMAESEIANELFGEAFVKHFTLTREWECQQSDKNDSQWELKRYFEII